ncbi:DUF2889 domain-containing protein [Pseudomonas putida]|uniref:DUF2889 domain-containing protein n=1 Tax=Pseudomonas putida TaxID=303 RepID=UPI0018A90EB5|nr:DUF2889 domain-containing protein [Pseudomonas putida]MBF8668358.1 DUF2889 domain-containing protein [Pseudomonas putida]MBF8710823.1 DUF2889 domain-containing protein [Pseudomonas putida]
MKSNEIARPPDQLDCNELPPPSPRIALHNRSVVMKGYWREDGLWDIEGELLDTKDTQWHSWEYGLLPSSVPVHHMRVRLTVDDSFRVREIVAALPTTPFPECQHGLPPLHKLVGSIVSNGWRNSLNVHLGGSLGCTHLRELLLNLGTVAYQTIHAEQRRREIHPLAEPTAHQPHWNKCVGWRLDGEVIRRHAPKFYQPPKKPNIKATDLYKRILHYLKISIS